MGEFIPWPSKPPFLKRWEGKGQELRRRLSLNDEKPLDPIKLIQSFSDMVLLNAKEMAGHCAEQVEVLKDMASEWWAASYRVGDGPWLILYNPWQAETRLRATLMEEIVHIYLKHKPTKIETDPRTGLPKRTFDKSKEMEAYGVGAAALLPYVPLVQKLRAGMNHRDIASHFGISEQLVNYRSNVTKAKEVASRMRK